MLHRNMSLRFTGSLNNSFKAKKKDGNVVGDIADLLVSRVSGKLPKYGHPDMGTPISGYIERFIQTGGKRY